MKLRGKRTPGLVLGIATTGYVTEAERGAH